MKLNALTPGSKVIFTSGNGIRHGLLSRQRSIGIVDSIHFNIITLKTHNKERFSAFTGASVQSQASITTGTSSEIDEITLEEALRKS